MQSSLVSWYQCNIDINQYKAYYYYIQSTAFLYLRNKSLCRKKCSNTESVAWHILLFIIFNWFLSHSPVPNRYTFTCPYCNCQNLDQDGLVEHCTSQHARDARQVVRPPQYIVIPSVFLRFQPVFGFNHGYSFVHRCFYYPHCLGVPHLCLNALGGP